ncbi:helix-turn-helix transcriptional regulator [Paraburkholderia silvatlantica]|uniref:DNA-binding CsgD family transcriptional regulator n=1 Tax=Paraburkholderia silvatlantica TaxID=321895 RepID=A0A2U1A723_9BURK|nr:helix-turn-helix transcriptional regulator [Paraburkholderia silvatlantica]MBB2931454.1 DNA-binding CsgD family transcriptional regulator [Paraburkholderia silvatlantica]PVY27880.1 LuxR family transcriptional regulator [Paraburkholderia silvatlantica]PXW34727.1 LuxR family transcriptional regulator [Paraburkholderia silvatlantica]PYE20545.1 LuxR family transcriptional regulator [Paraburkholderia silvatlantica]TDQ98593.1 LuxR family transcriptional regulator [Paraburkholderia silvatlantica]
MVKKDQLIGDLYETALKQDGFLETIQRVAEWVGADIFHMYSIDAHRNAPRFSYYTPTATSFGAMIASYVEYYRGLDPRVDLVNGHEPNTWFACQDHFNDSYVSRSEFFQDFLIPNGLRYMFGTRIASEGCDDVLVALVRATGRPAFTKCNRDELASVSGHMQRAIRCWQDASELHHSAAVGTEMSGQLNVAAIVLDRQMRSVSLNPEAETMLRTGEGLKLRDGRLVATSSRQNDALQAACVRVARTGHGETIVLDNEFKSGHQIFMSINALPSQTGAARTAGPGLLVMTRCRGGARLVTASQLRQAFDLSGAEAAAAEALIDGKSPDEYASQKNVSIATVRTQLRAVFEKTGTRSQAEAVALMMWVLTQRTTTDAEVRRSASPSA